MNTTIKIYTDGSCHTQLLIGAWAAIIFVDEDKIELSGLEYETTHNRMELTGVIKAIEYLEEKGLVGNSIDVYSDSQYVVNLLIRKERLKARNFITKKGTPIQNVDLVKALVHQIETNKVKFVKVKAHQKDGDKINREVDIIVRQLVRKEALKLNGK